MFRTIADWTALSWNFAWVEARRMAKGGLALGLAIAAYAGRAVVFHPGFVERHLLPRRTYAALPTQGKIN